MSTKYDEKFSDLDLMHGGITFYGDRDKVEQLYEDLLKNKEENKEYDPINNNEKIDPSIKLICDNKNIKISNVSDEVIYIEGIKDIEFVDDKAYFEISLWGGGFLPYVIFDKIVQEYEIDYINLSIVDGLIFFYSKDKSKLKKVFNKVLEDLEIKVDEVEKEMEITIKEEDIKKNNINSVNGIYNEEDYYCFHIEKQKHYDMSFYYIKELLEIEEDVNIAFYLNNMNSGFTCYDESKLFCRGKYIIDGPQEHYFDLGENSEEWFESKNIKGLKYDKVLKNKKELIDEIRFLTDKEIKNDTHVEEMEKYILELNDKLYDDIMAFMIHNINRIKEVPFYL